MEIEFWPKFNNNIYCDICRKSHHKYNSPRRNHIDCKQNKENPIMNYELGVFVIVSSTISY